MLLATLLSLCALQAPPAPALPAFARVVRGAELIAYGRVLRLEPHALETAEGKGVRIAHGVKQPRLAELELTSVLKGDASTRRLWLLAQPDNALYDLDLSDAGAHGLFFLTLGSDPTPEGCTYLAKTLERVWRCSEGRSGFVPVDESAPRALLAPRWSFAPGDGELDALAKGSDGLVARVDAKLLETRLHALIEEQHAVWIRASAKGSPDGFAWELALRYDRSAALTIERAQGTETREILFGHPIVDGIEQQLASGAPTGKPIDLGVERPGGLVRSVAVHEGPELKLQRLEREWMEDPEHQQLARWALKLYASIRAGIREPGLLDGRPDDRDWLR